MPPAIIEKVTAIPTSADKRSIVGLKYFLNKSQLLAVQVVAGSACGSMRQPVAWLQLAAAVELPELGAVVAGVFPSDIGCAKALLETDRLDIQSPKAITTKLWRKIDIYCLLCFKRVIFSNYIVIFVYNQVKLR